jgi:hypothetical protein
MQETITTVIKHIMTAVLMVTAPMMSAGEAKAAHPSKVTLRTE